MAEDPWQVTQIGTSREGRAIEAHSLGEGPVVLVLGGMHGDEPHGAYCAAMLLDEADEIADRAPDRRVVIVRAVNPDGLEAETRGNAARVDLNRNFPTENWSPRPGRGRFRSGPHAGCEPETQAVVALVEQLEPQRILTLHAPLEVVNYDGPDDGGPAAIGAACGYPVSADIGYATPGSFGTYAGVERAIPTITLEFGEESCAATWERCREALLIGIAHPLREPDADDDSTDA